MQEANMGCSCYTGEDYIGCLYLFLLNKVFLIKKENKITWMVESLKQILCTYMNKLVLIL